MSLRDKFLSTIVENPDDDTARLVYADWLEEQGTAADLARARLIRLQIELQELHDDATRRDMIVGECDQLIERYWSEWTQGFQADRFTASDYKAAFSRGFLSFVCLEEEDLDDPALDALLAREPITHFFMLGIDSFPETIADWKHLPRIRGLKFTGEGENVKSLLRSPLLTGLQMLDGTGRLEEDDIALIATDERFAGLMRLEIGYNNLDDRAVKMIALSETLSEIVALEYGSNRTTIAALETIAASPLAHRLKFIGLGQEEWSDVPRLGSHAAELLAGFRSLQVINLSGQRIGDAGAEHLARSPHLAELKSLHLGQNNLGLRGLTALLSSPHLAGLEELDLSNNPTGCNWAAAFTRATPGRLRKLTLAGNEIDGATVELLANTGVLQGVIELSLRGNPLGDQGAIALARSPHLAELRRLDLELCHIGEEGVAALAKSPTFARLEGVTGLKLAHNHYDTGAACILA